MPKKKLPTGRKSNCLSSLMRFSWPKLHKGKRWFVDFFAFDPATQTMRRKKYFIPESLKQTEKSKRAAETIKTLTDRLQKGWNPWIAEGDSRGFTEIDKVIDRYIDYVGKSDRAKTRHSYSSRVNILKEYIASMPIPIRYVYQYTTEFVSGFLDYIYLDRDCGARTRNNYRGWCSSFAEWLVERKYIEDNPVAVIHKIKEQPKKRKDLSDEMLLRMKEHLGATDKFFLLACMMEYYTFIRPTELSNIKIKDFSIMKQTVFVSGEISKNKRDDNVGLNATIIKLMLDLHVFDCPGEFYLFGKNFKPSEKRAGPDQFNKRWVKMRVALGWSDEYQFYSLKDSGIRDLANDVGIVVARDQARHTDISTTNKYLRGHDSTVHEETKVFKGSLG